MVLSLPAAALDAQRVARRDVFLAMLEVPWEAGEGIPEGPMDGTEYAELLAAGRSIAQAQGRAHELWPFVVHDCKVCVACSAG